MRARALQRIFNDKKGEFIEQDEEFDESPEFINSLVSVQAAEILDTPNTTIPVKPATSVPTSPSPTPVPATASAPTTTPSV